MKNTVRIIDRLSTIDENIWNELASGEGPFLRYEFLHALEQSGCCCVESGWRPHHILIESNNTVLAIIPGYLKTHSFGEYVFDQAWAEAYHRHGMNYYPKWIAAIPFTPVTGARILTKHPAKIDEHLLTQIFNLIGSSNKPPISSCHWLFTNGKTQQILNQHSQLLTRYSVQFQWHNYDYHQFDDFLAALTSRKRKEIKKTRSKLAAQGITYRHITGQDISEHDLNIFVQCYQSTYLKRSGHMGYLNATFFQQLRDTLADNMLLVIASRNDKPIASALFFYDNTGLYGRYWGALENISGLHFCCCYFEGIEFAIKKQLPVFNPGTQGEHKILRGFEPIYCQSQHLLYAPEFHAGVTRFLQQETQHIVEYFNQAKDVLPFNSEVASKLITTNISDPLSETHNHNENIQ